MVCPPPFTPDLLDRAPGDDAWRGGVHRPPCWRHYADIGAVDAAGLHVLLRATGLPREELLHMAHSSTGWVLSPSLIWVWDHEATMLLGRIALDHEYDQQGGAWGDTDAERARAYALGRCVLCAWFT